MALRNTNNSEGYGTYTEDNSFNGFSLDAYRRANEFRIYLKKNKTDPQLIFRAYAQGNFGFEAAMSHDSFASGLLDKVNGMLGPVMKSFMKNGSESFGYGSMSGAFAAPLHPFITSTEPLKFTLNGYIPLIDPHQPDIDGDPATAYSQNIEKPINTLLNVTVPDENSVSNEVGSKLTEVTDSALDWLFGGGGDFWTKVQDTIKGMRDDFFKGIYMLDNPIQYAEGNDLILRMGPWRVEGIIIDNVKIDWSPLLYASGKNVYPESVKVSIQCMTKKKVTVTTLGIGSDHNYKE